MRIPGVFAATVLAASLLSSLARTAQAQDRYLSVALGTSETRRSNVHLIGFPTSTDVTFGGVTWRNPALAPTRYYVVKFGQYFGPRWGAELDFTHNKAIARTEKTVAVNGTWMGEPIADREPMENKVDTLRFTNGVNILSALALYRLAGPHGHWVPYVGVGPSYYLVWSRNTVNGEERYSRYHGVGWGWQGEAGVRYRLNPHNALYVEFKYTSGPGKAKTAENGDISTTLRSFHQTFGYSYGF